MEYEESYRGRRIIITTGQAEGGWTSIAELEDAGRRMPAGERTDERHPSEEEAKRAALSSAVEAIDRARISKGKP